MADLARLPCATPEFAGVGGTIRTRPEDFFVQEIGLYEPSGEGEHILFEAQKVGLTTRDAVRRIARALDLAPSEVGYAGLKDKHAITRQVFSVPGKNGVDEDRVMRMEADGVFPHWAARHGNKLKVGHLAGNRFAVKIRDVNPTDVVKLRPVLDRLARDGLPNYFGEQRFGIDAGRPTDVLGLALIRRDYEGFCRLLLGGDDHRPDVAEARTLFDAGDRQAALAAWPRNLAMERRVLEVLVRGNDPRKAAMAVDKVVRRFYLSAAQSAVFNQVLSQRVSAGTYTKVHAGDVAVKHIDELRTGGMFLVEDVQAEQERADRWEISPTGPLFGKKMKQPAGAVADAERAAVEAVGARPEDFDTETGARRPLRVRPSETTLAAGSDEHGGHITVAFSLPAGCFATVLLRELMKSPAEPSAKPPPSDRGGHG
jgi:tRNA pseudouridine13 synthase